MIFIFIHSQYVIEVYMEKIEIQTTSEIFQCHCLLNCSRRICTEELNNCFFESIQQILPFCLTLCQYQLVGKIPQTIPE